MNILIKLSSIVALVMAPLLAEKEHHAQHDKNTTPVEQVRIEPKTTTADPNQIDNKAVNYKN